MIRNCKTVRKSEVREAHNHITGGDIIIHFKDNKTVVQLKKCSYVIQLWTTLSHVEFHDPTSH